MAKATRKKGWEGKMEEEAGNEIQTFKKHCGLIACRFSVPGQFHSFFFFFTASGNVLLGNEIKCFLIHGYFIFNSLFV